MSKLLYTESTIQYTDIGDSIVTKMIALVRYIDKPADEISRDYDCRFEKMLFSFPDIIFIVWILQKKFDISGIL